MSSTFQIPSFSLTVQIAIARARMVAKRDFRRAVEILRGACVCLESAIAMVARFYAAVTRWAKQPVGVGPQELAS